MPLCLKQISRTMLFGMVAAVAASPVAQAVPQSTTIQLNYGGNGPCKFITPTGVNINGTTGQMSADGAFDPTSNCPSGGSTGPAAITMDTSPVTVDPDDEVNFTWSAVADACRFDGSVLPSPVTNWSSSGYACVGADNCADPHAISFTPANAGNYTFKLTCTSGAQPQTPVSKTKTVTVAGTSEPPPDTSCPSFQSNGVTVTRQLVGDVSDNSGSRRLRDVAVTNWSNVFGYAWAVYPTLPRYGWPGSPAGTTKLWMKKNQYWALAFTIPSDFQLTEYGTTLPGQYYPLGGWTTNASNTTGGLKVSVSISENCGDFTLPTSSDPRYACFKEYTVETGYLLNWVVTQAGQRIAGACNLDPGKSYYLNLIAAPFNNPTSTYCTEATCRFNMQQRSNIPTGPVCTGDPSCQ